MEDPRRKRDRKLVPGPAGEQALRVADRRGSEVVSQVMDEATGFPAFWLVVVPPQRDRRRKRAGALSVRHYTSQSILQAQNWILSGTAILMSCKSQAHFLKFSFFGDSFGGPGEPPVISRDM